MKNKLIIIICILFPLVVVIASFGEIISDYMPNLFEYNTVKNSCPSEKKICQKFKTQEELDTYLANDPRKKFDAITLSSYVIVCSSNFGILVFLSPLIMVLLVIFQIQDEISSRYIENILTRTNYKSLLKKYVLVAAKAALLIPLIYAVILFISCLITRFDFSHISSAALHPETSTFEYNHFMSYSLVLSSFLYLLHFAYALIGVFMSFISKNKIICSILGYIYFVVLNLTYMIIGAFVIRDFFGFKFGTDNYFNLLGQYWFINDTANIWVSYLTLLSVVGLNLLIVYIFMGKKERAVRLYEKQVI